jgi:hypothetical protein
MGLFDRIFRRSNKRHAYPADLQLQVARAISGLQV